MLDLFKWRRIVRQHLAYGVEVKKSTVHGFGVFATRDFSVDEFIGIMSGKVPEEGNSDCPHTLWFEGDNGNLFALEPEWPFRFLNHSSKPNADTSTPCVVAIQEIKGGNEILIHYGEDWEDVE